MSIRLLVLARYSLAQPLRRYWMRWPDAALDGPAKAGAPSRAPAKAERPARAAADASTRHGGEP